MLKTVNDQGEKIPLEKLPLAKTLYTHRLAYGNLWIQSLDGNKYNISITSYPIIGRSKKFTEAIATFWAEDEKK